MHKRQLLLAEDDFKSLHCQLRYAESQMERLKKTNVFNATFHIWHTGHFATINGFRYVYIGKYTGQVSARQSSALLLISW